MGIARQPPWELHLRAEQISRSGVGNDKISCPARGSQQSEGNEKDCTIALAYLYNSLRHRNIETEGLRMNEKTLVEKAAEKVGYGLAMAEDVAGSVKTAVSAAVTTVTNTLTPAKKATKKAVKKAVAKRPVKKVSAKEAAKKLPAKKTGAKRTTAKKTAKKSLKQHAKKAGRTGRP